MFYILNIFQHFQYLKCRTFSLLAESAFFNPFFLEVKDDLRALFDLLTFLLPRSGSLQISSGGYTRPITLSDEIEEIKEIKIVVFFKYWQPIQLWRNTFALG